MSIKLVGDELGGVEDHPEPSQGLAYLPVGGGKLIQSLGLSRYELLRPIQGKALQCGGVVFSGAHLEELSFPPLERVLEKSEDDAAGDAREAHPEAFALFLHLEKVKKDVHRGRDAQIPTENLETPHEGPVVGVKLGRGRGSDDFSKQLPFEGSERKAWTHSFNYHLVDEEERASPSGPFIYTNGLPRPCTANEDVGVMGLVEGFEVIESGVPPVASTSSTEVKVEHSQEAHRRPSGIPPCSGTWGVADRQWPCFAPSDQELKNEEKERVQRKGV